jgi:WD40 repeat protein
VHPSRALHIVLGLIAIAGFFLFITACMPSWSPDGSQLVFDYWDPDSKDFGIALYDVASGKATSIYTYHPKSKSEARVSAQWKDDGRTILVFVSDDGAPDEEKSFLTEIAPNGDLVRTIKFHTHEPYFSPVAEVRGFLYLWGDHPLKVDLSSGESTEIPDFSNAYFFRAADQPLFLINGNAENEKTVFAIGSLEPNKLSEDNYVSFEIPNHSDSEIDSFIPPPAIDPSGRIAFPVARKDDTYFIAICDQHGLLRTIDPKLDPNSKLGNLQWSPDGASLYAGVLGSVKKDVSVWSIAEINAETGEISRMIPLSQMDASHDDLDTAFFHFFPVLISPDGRTLATNLAGAPDKSISESDRALYLIDLGSDKAKVTKIPYPSAPATK